jgi:oxygen-independent coproporphyrinogen-3 oxidase
LEGGTPASADRLLRDTFFVSPARRKLCVRASEFTVEAASLLAPADVSVYIGIPFCPTRCAYCSFVSQSVEKSMKLIPDFVEALKRDIRATADAARGSGRRITAIYFGGGTPTTLSAAQLDEVLCALRSAFRPDTCREFTVEAGRPDTITREKLEVLRAHGVTRISVNPQTMSDRVLEAIGRKHTAADVLRALELVRAVGGFQVNMDLIAGLPEDSPDGFADTLERVLALGAENVTVHTLALKKGSSFAERHQAQLSPQLIADMLSTAHRMLSEAGYAPYYLYRQKYSGGSFENVGWAKEEKICRYNVYMMEELLPVLAAGAGAVTKLSGDGTGRIERLTNPKYPADYCAAIGEILKKKTGLAGLFDGRTKSGETIERNENDEI